MSSSGTDLHISIIVCTTQKIMWSSEAGTFSLSQTHIILLSLLNYPLWQTCPPHGSIILTIGSSSYETCGSATKNNTVCVHFSDHSWGRSSSTYFSTGQSNNLSSKRTASFYPFPPSIHSLNCRTASCGLHVTRVIISCHTLDNDHDYYHQHPIKYQKLSQRSSAIV